MPIDLHAQRRPSPAPSILPDGLETSESARLPIRPSLRRRIAILGCLAVIGAARLLAGPAGDTVPLRPQPASTGGPATGPSVDLHAPVRAAALRCQDSIVTVQFDFRTDPTARPIEGPSDQRVRVDGTIVDPTGLVVCSSDKLESRAFAAGPRGARGDLSSRTQAIRVSFADGGETDARIVLEKRELGLVVLRTKGHGMPLVPVAIDAGLELNLLDRLYVVGAAGMGSDRAVLVFDDAVVGVTASPYGRYILRAAPSTGLPVFTADGRCAGVLLSPAADWNMESATLASLIATAPAILLPPEMVALLRKARAVE